MRKISTRDLGTKKAICMFLKSPNDTEINSYRPLYGLRQCTSYHKPTFNNPNALESIKYYSVFIKNSQRNTCNNKITNIIFINSKKNRTNELYP